MPLELLLEIGCEEIPAGFLARVLPELERLATAKLASARLGHGAVRVLGTPRRLALAVDGIADRQPDLEERVAGPPVSAGFDKEGKPTKAAQGFAERNGVAVAALERSPVEGKKGEYLVCTRRETGRSAAVVVPGVLAELCRELPWPKSMRWGHGETAFVRPVHWIVALLGGEVVPLDFAGIVAGRETRGHRFLASGVIALSGKLAEYDHALRDGFVIVDPAVRRTMIIAELARIERETKAKVRADEALLAEVTNLVEYPVAVCGEFSPSYLEVPAEVVVSAMRAHQRYFAMEGEDGRLANRFVTIAGTITSDPAQVRHGNERVLAARLADASFFFVEDRKHPLTHFADKLEGVVFQKKLGTTGAKARRIAVVATALARQHGADPAAAERAGLLCKADLVTSMVGEFPDLQGVMGRHYARLGGESEAVSLAIAEHYLPRGSQGALPSEALGAVVGVADRIDTIVGCFAAGLQPTGSADPYGLRRAAVAILSIYLDRGWTGGLSRLVALAAEGLATAVVVADAVVAEVREFFRTRLRGLLIETLEIPADCVDAALATGADDPVDVRARATAIGRLRARADFEPLAVAFKRVANILKDGWSGGAPEPKLFQTDDERALWSEYQRIEAAVHAHLGERDYGAALRVLSELKAPVDRFFDKVLVMDDNEKVRQNRLALLGNIDAAFRRIADFRQLAV